MRGVLSALATLGVLAACTEEPQPNRSANPANPERATSRMLEDYTMMDRTTFVQAVEEQLAVINRDLTLLEERVAEAGPTAQPDVKEAVETLPEKRDAFQKKFTNFKDSVADASYEVRKEIVDSCRNLKEALRRALKKTA